MRTWDPRALVAVALALLASGCQQRAAEQPPASAPASEPAAPAEQSLSLVIARNATMLMGIPGVVGVYEGETSGKPVLRVMVVAREDSILNKIPRTLEGYDVEIEVGGPVRPMNH
jgi:hypothetical protein